MRLDTDKKLKILYVEDEQKLREQVASCLRYFFNVTVAENGKIGFEKFVEDSFDLVITDILMLEKTGLELINDIRKINNQIPIIITSAYTEEYKENLESIENLKSVKKPFEMRELVENVRALVPSSSV